MRLTVLLLLLLPACSWFRSDDKKPEAYWAQFSCPAFKEFVTTYNYLKEQKTFKMEDKDAQAVAQRVARGCEGAAKRFIATTDLMVRAQLNSWDAINLGEEMAQAKDDAADAFITIFKAAFLESYLDLDLRTAIATARSLSVEFEGNLKQAKDDYKDLVAFCVSRKGLALSRPNCAIFAGKVAKSAERSKKTSSAKSFIQLYEFLTEAADGPRLAAFQARQVAEEVIVLSPHAAENFMEGYRFVAGKGGTKGNRDQNVTFAKSLAKSTVKLDPELKTRQPER